jgi:glycosyltransferase involved in cell wall biosynthesis
LCLDVTRLVSRVGLGAATGIDRVERAYLDNILSRAGLVFGLCRLASGLALLDRGGLTALAARLDGRVRWGGPDLVARLSRSLPPARRGAEADVRRLAMPQTFRGRGDAALARRLPAGTLYLNTGHANLAPATVAMLRRVEGLEIAVLIHDTIPLDFAQYQRPGTVERFGDKLRLAAEAADWVIANSRDTADRLRHHMGRAGRVPRIVVAHLGVTAPPVAPEDLPPGLPPAQPYFVALGTIEPRKNHALLLDAWEEMARESRSTCPFLVIAGRRGWNNAALFARLDASPLRGDRIVEAPGLSDGAVGALLAGAAGLLFPSHAEGFGLPPAEAALLGTPVVAAPLPVLREFLGNIPVYADTAEMYLWITTIRQLAGAGAGNPGTGAGKRPAGIPTWQEHFNTVFTRLG